MTERRAVVRRPVSLYQDMTISDELLRDPTALSLAVALAFNAMAERLGLIESSVEYVTRLTDGSGKYRIYGVAYFTAQDTARIEFWRSMVINGGNV